MQALIEAVPYTIHIVLTDNGIQFGDMPSRRTGPTARYRLHMFDRICREQGIEHRLTKPNHPWTNGQVERMNRTLKEATVRRYYYETHRQLREHLEAFLNAYNFAKRLKTLRGLTPYEHICKAWADQPSPIQIRSNPPHFGTEHLVFRFRRSYHFAAPAFTNVGNTGTLAVMILVWLCI